MQQVRHQMQYVLSASTLAVALLVSAVAAADAPAEDAETLVIPWCRDGFSADEGCDWQRPGPELRMNAHYLAPPGPGEDWAAWLRQLRDYRDAVRAHVHDIADSHIGLQFDGVRAWVRTGREWAFAADFAPSERLVLEGEARWREGNDRLCVALDWCDRGQGSEGRWRGWSTVVATATIPRDGQWHPFRLATEVPAFDRPDCWARPIIGMDATFDGSKGAMALRDLRVLVPKTAERTERWRRLATQSSPAAAFDDSLYRRDDLRWMASNFVCGFVMVYDRSFWDPATQRYRVAELYREAVREFGGFDSVVLWHAYPRIGADERNQFDFFRDMPGGLTGLREVTRQFHRNGVKVFLPYNPWDTGTNREAKSDEAALAEAVAATEADGIFLDTMVQAPARLREAVDAVRPGVAFAPEGHPLVEEMERCSGSWAQGLQPFPGIGVLRLKWIEPRHMQHQIRRWDRSHQDELAAAWLNGSGMLVWENVFGTWNPWNAADRATLRQMTPVLRHFAPLFTDGDWLPCHPTLLDGVRCGCWEGDGGRLWTLVNESGTTLEAPVLEVADRGERFFDLWNGRSLEPERANGRCRLRVALGRFGAIAALRADQVSADERRPFADFRKLLEGQQAEAARVAGDENDPHGAARSVVEPRQPPAVPAGRPADLTGMLPVEAGTHTFAVRHMRRECGCYPDPGTPTEKGHDSLRGYPHDETMTHQVAVTLAPYRIGPQPVTNAQFEAFLRATGYRPQCPDRFLKHWGGPTCPTDLRDGPVVYVDLNDARAYAAWAGKRLPTEWEWQRAAELHGDAFRRGEVWEWTESERDDGHTRFVMLRGGSRYQAQGSIWYFPGERTPFVRGEQPIGTHAKFLLLYPGLDRCSTIGFRCVVSAAWPGQRFGVEWRGERSERRQTPSRLGAPLKRVRHRVCRRRRCRSRESARPSTRPDPGHR
jgi:formylglycine-generating enzyme required for sulfatase activity